MGKKILDRNNYQERQCLKEASGYHRRLIHQNIKLRVLKNFSPGDIWIITPIGSQQDLWLNGNSVQHISINQDQLWNSDGKVKCLSQKKMINLLLAESRGIIHKSACPGGTEVSYLGNFGFVYGSEKEGSCSSSHTSTMCCSSHFIPGKWILTKSGSQNWWKRI